MEPPAPRRLALAVSDPALRRKLERLLRAEDMEVTALVPGAGGRKGPVEADVLVLQVEAGLQELPDVLSLPGEAGGPGVVVIGGERRAEDEVRLVAAGATAVLDTKTGDDELAEQLVELVEAEAGGGLHGPEAGGSVAEPKLADFQARCPRMRDFLDVVRRVADSDSTLLVTGETGVGKERLARAIHAESSRAAGPFVIVNCGALPETLLESELFGHERGAFTGASSARKGRFAVADGGTILLDEVGEMPPHLQVRLLTVLQRREVQPLGAGHAVPVDVRVLAATNRDLAADVESGRFRQDLYFRLNVVSLVIPPLRERLEDLAWLLGRFLRHFVELHGKPRVSGVTRAAFGAMHAYDWPGNVRELVNVVERAVLLSEGDRLRLENLPESVRGGSRVGANAAAPAASEAERALLALPLPEARRRVLEGFEHRYLRHHLTELHGAVGEVAGRAGINPRTLYEKMRRLGLRKEDFH